MRREPVASARDLLPIAFPALMLLVFFVLPFGTMIAVSFFKRDSAAFYTPEIVLDQYLRFVTPFFGGVLGFSIWLALLVSLVCLAIGFPFTWFLSRLARRAQVFWLVLLLSVLALSEVIIGFAFSTLLSRTAGITQLLAAIGLMNEPDAWVPGFGAVLAGMVYLAFPYTVLILYPSLVRLDSNLVEAAATMGATPRRAFLDVVIGLSRNAIVATGIMVFVFALGAYLLPQILGRPEHWTLSVLITDQAIFQSNMPFAAAMSVFLVVVSVSLVVLTVWLGQREDA